MTFYDLALTAIALMTVGCGAGGGGASAGASGDVQDGFDGPALSTLWTQVTPVTPLFDASNGQPSPSLVLRGDLSSSGRFSTNNGVTVSLQFMEPAPDSGTNYVGFSIATTAQYGNGNSVGGGFGMRSGVFKASHTSFRPNGGSVTSGGYTATYAAGVWHTAALTITSDGIYRATLDGALVETGTEAPITVSGNSLNVAIAGSATNAIRIDNLRVSHP